jgi:hypothetical protein
MSRDYSWFQPVPRNLSVDARQLRAWQILGPYFRRTAEFRLLSELERVQQQVTAQRCEESTRVYWLLPYRGKLRSILSKHMNTFSRADLGAVRYYMAYCPPSMIPICAWLIGRCADRFQLFKLDELARRQPRQTRKHVAKALRRLEAWPLLVEMADMFPGDKAVQGFAGSPTTRRAFDQRLRRYIGNVDDSHADEVVTPSRMPFWALQTSWDVTPPKSVAAIRRILERIRHWVRWGVT